MNKDEIRNIIIGKILQVAPEINEDAIVEDENIQRSLEIDSFDFLKILTVLNEELGIEVAENDYDKVDTIEKMVHYFYERL